MLEREEESVCRGRSVSNARRLRIIAARAHIPMSAVALAPSRDARRWLDKSSAPTYEQAAREREREPAACSLARIARSHAARARGARRESRGTARTNESAPAARKRQSPPLVRGAGGRWMPRPTPTEAIFVGLRVAFLCCCRYSLSSLSSLAHSHSSLAYRLHCLAHTESGSSSFFLFSLYSLSLSLSSRACSSC